MDVSSIKQEQREGYSENHQDEYAGLTPFICGLCHTSFGLIVAFYKHFKEHSESVGKDSLHFCGSEECERSERDRCGKSLDVETFHCSKCAASFPTICMLHKHMQEHDPKGSYTVDLRSKTGYPSSNQFPQVTLSKTVLVPSPSSNIKATRKKGRPCRNVEKEISKESRIEKPVKNVDARASPPDAMPSTSASDHAITTRRRGRPCRNVKNETSNKRLSKFEKDVMTAVAEGSSPDQKPSTSASDHINPVRSVGRPRKKVKNDIRKSSITTRTRRSQVLEGNPANQDITAHADSLDPDQKSRASKSDKSSEQFTPESFENAPSGKDVYVEEVQSDEMEDYAEDDDAGFNDDDPEEDDDFDMETVGLDINRVLSATADKESEDADKNENSKTETKDADDEEITKAAENNVKTEPETDDSKAYNFRRKMRSNRVRVPPEHIKVEQVKNKRYLCCEICGIRKEQYMLLRHIKKAHNEDDVSDVLIEYLKGIQSRPWTKKPKKVSKKADKVDSDEDYDPKEDNARPFMVKKKPSEELLTGRQHFRVAGKKKHFIECIICKMVVRRDRIIRHEAFHKTKQGKVLFDPSNLKRCEKCDRLQMKKTFNMHRCHVFMEIDMKEKEEKLRLKEEKEKGIVKDGEEREQDPKLRYQAKKNERLPCHVCGVLVKRYAIKKHLFKHSDKKPFKCTKCPNKFFAFMELLRKHDKDCHGERLFQCDQCPSSFRNAGMLKGHYMVHTDERPFPCLICDKRFRKKSQLKNHSMSATHGGFARFACEECGKKFLRKTNLRDHVKVVHRRVRNWVCSWPQCAKPFSSGTVLRRHMLIHTGDKPERCTHCEVGFSQRSELKNHLLKRHNVTEMPPPGRANPYMGIPPTVIKPDTSKEEEGEVTRKLKTVMFTPRMTQPDLEAIAPKPSPLKVKLPVPKPQPEFINTSSSTVPVDPIPSYTIPQPLYSIATFEQVSSVQNGCQQDVTNGRHQGVVIGNHSENVQAGLSMQETSGMLMHEGFPVVKAELVSQPLDMPMDFSSGDDVLTTMAAVMPHHVSENSVNFLS